MVDIEELKINNYVMLFKNKDGVKENIVCNVSGIDEDKSVTLRSLSGDIKYTCRPRDIKPIRLTVKLIREIGFEKDFYQELKYIIGEKDMVELSICFRERKFYVQLSYVHDTADMLGQIIEYELENMKYLHHFQNYYSDYTQKTLTVDNFFKED